MPFPLSLIFVCDHFADSDMHEDHGLNHGEITSSALAVVKHRAVLLPCSYHRETSSGALAVERRRRLFAIITLAPLLVMIITQTSRRSDTPDASFLAGIKIGSDVNLQIPIDVELSSTSDGSNSKIFNPHFDLDGPQVQNYKGTMGENDIRSALAGLVSKDLDSTNLKSSNVQSKPTHLFDPSHDPDAPTPKLSGLQMEELTESRRADRMKTQLKIEAQLAMLTERQHSRWIDDKKDEPRRPKFHAKSNFRKNPESLSPSKPSFQSISDEVRHSLQDGDDPNKIITKELQSEMQVRRIFTINIVDCNQMQY